MLTKKGDVAFGTQSENSCKSLIEKLTGPLINTEPFHLFDFYNDDYLVELKSRRNNYDKYPTTMIGKNKIDKAAREQFKKCIFCFL